MSIPGHDKLPETPEEREDGVFPACLPTMDGVASVRPRRMGSRLRCDNPFQPGGDASQDLYSGLRLPHTPSNRIPFRIPMRSPSSGAPPRIPFPTP